MSTPSGRLFFAGDATSPPDFLNHTTPPAPCSCASAPNPSSVLRLNAGPARNAHAADGAARGERLLERREAGAGGLRRQVHERQVEAQIGPVGAVALHRLAERQTRERPRRRDARRGEAGLEERLDDVEHVLLRRKRHLEVDLRELVLAVGAQVFVAEAARELVVLLEPRDHQDLLEELRRLAAARTTGRDARAPGRENRARPSGVERVSIGVSISRNPRAWSV